MVQRLSDDGYLLRTPHPDDGRSILARITPAGSRTARDATERFNRHIFCNLPLDPTDQIGINNMLATVRHAFGDFT